MRTFITWLIGLGAVGMVKAQKVKGTILNYDILTSTWYPLAKKYASIYNVKVDIILGIIKQESNGNKDAKGATSDYGLMQITQPALTDFNVHNRTSYNLSDMYDPEKNIQVGTWFYSRMKRLTGDEKAGLQAYNAGYGAWTRNKSVSLEYANSVLKHTSNVSPFVLLEQRKGTTNV